MTEQSNVLELDAIALIQVAADRMAESLPRIHHTDKAGTGYNAASGCFACAAAAQKHNLDALLIAMREKASAL